MRPAGLIIVPPPREEMGHPASPVEGRCHTACPPHLGLSGVGGFVWKYTFFTKVSRVWHFLKEGVENATNRSCFKASCVIEVS